MKTTVFKTFKTILLVGTAVLLASCSDILSNDADSNKSGGKTTVTFDFSTASRTALPSVNLTSYKYKVHYKLSTESAYTVSSAFDADSAIALSLPAGTYDFEVNAYADTDTVFSSPILTGSVTEKEISASSNTVSVVLKAATGGTGSVKITLKVATSLGAAKICAGLYDEIPEEVPAYDSAKALTIDTETNAGYQTVTYANASVDSGVSKYVVFFLYDSSDAYIMPYADSVYVVSGLESVDSHTIDYAKTEEPEPSEPDEPEEPSSDETVIWTGNVDLQHWANSENSSIQIEASKFANAKAGDYLVFTISKGAECTTTDEQTGKPCTNDYSIIQPISSWDNGNIDATTDTTGASVINSSQLEVTEIISASGSITVNYKPNDWTAIKENGLIIFGHKVVITKIELKAGTGSDEPETPEPTTDLVLYTSSETAGTKFTTSEYYTNLSLDSVVDLTGYKYLNIEFSCPDLGSNIQLMMKPYSDLWSTGHPQGEICTETAFSSKTVMQTKFGTTFGKYIDYSVTPSVEKTISDNKFGSIQIFTQDTTNWKPVNGVEVYITKITATNTELGSD